MKDYLRVSSLGSYFGVGFNDPAQQFKYDMDLEQQEFDEDSQRRINLGKVFEDASLDYFETELGIKISDRNTKTLSFYDDKLHGKLDGLTLYNGEKTVVENKISNSQGGKFTEDIGYHFQCQAYMLATDSKQALLLGIYQGKPIYTLLKRDEGMIADIKTMVDFILDYAQGLESWDNYPVHLMQKYSNTKMLTPIKDVDKGTLEAIKRIKELAESIKVLEKEKAQLEAEIKDRYETGVIESDGIKCTIAEQTRAGGYDIDLMSIEHPEIDYAKYRKPDSTFRVLRIK